MGFGLLALLFHLGIPISSRADALDIWFVRDSGVTNDFKAVAYGKGTFVAAGVGEAVLISTNGLDWPSNSVGQAGTAKFCATYGNGIFLLAATGSNGTNVLVSTDMSNWSAVRSASNVVYYGASYVGGFYFLVGRYRTILTATNIDLSCAGQSTNCNWSLRYTGADTALKGIAFGNGIYVSVGSTVYMTSIDAITWSLNTPFFTPISANDVAFGNGVFVVVGNGGINSSTNGSSWTLRYYGITETLNRVAYGNGTFVAVGSGGRILTSSDGVSWRTRPCPTASNLTGVTYGNGTFVITGDGGTILQSDVLPPRLEVIKDAGGAEVVLALTGEIGRGYRIQGATNLSDTNWADVGAFTNSADTVLFTDIEATNYFQRFYRAVSP